MEPGFVKIIHPETQNVAEVPRSSLTQHYSAGWALLDESPAPDPAPDPKPVRATAAAKAKAAAADSSGSNTKEGE